MNIDTNILYINIENIIPNRFQPRLSFDEEALKELAASIKEHGIIQPLVVRKLQDNKYEIIAGERRYKASQLAGLDKVPVIVTMLDDNESAEVALIENLQRKNLTAIEEAKSYKKLLDRGYLTQEELAARLGVSQSSIANKIRLLNLSDEVQDALMNDLISERHARSLLQLNNKDEQIDMLNNIITNRLTVRQLDTEIKNKLNKEEVYSIKEEKPMEVFDFTIPDDEPRDLEIERIIAESKKDLEKEYNSLNIPFGEEVKPEPKKVLEKQDIIIEGKIDTVIEQIKKIEQLARTKGFEIDTEEYDFEDLYQIIIKIEK